jgi:hypothetical protein
MKLIDVTKSFATEEQCLAYLEASRWPDGVRCTVCGGEEVSKITRKTASKNKRAQIYQCLENSCKSQFSATNGTIFSDSHLPLNKWFMAIALLVDAKKSMSALQLSRHLACNYRTAWYLAHRIREAIVDTTIPKMTGIVEVDETYIGGRNRFPGRSTRQKDAVIGIRQRGGPLRFIKADGLTREKLYDVIAEHVSNKVETIMTDEFPSYNFKETQFQGKHKRIKHKEKVYVRGNVHTNTVGSAFSLLKRGITGSFHQVSIKHFNAI